MNYPVILTAFKDFIFHQKPAEAGLIIATVQFILYLITVVYSKLTYPCDLLKVILFSFNVILSALFIYYMILINGNNYALQFLIIPLLILLYIIYFKILYIILE